MKHASASTKPIQVKESEFSYHIHHPSINCLEQKLKKETKRLFGKKFQAEMLSFVDTCGKFNASQLLINNQQGFQAIDLKSQIWMRQEIYPKLAALGIRRKAYLVSPDIITQASVEQTAQEDKKQLFEFEFFKDYEQALKWLRNQA